MGAHDTATAQSAAFTPHALGYWCFAGNYSGDGNYSASSDATIDECFDVTQASSSTLTVPANSKMTIGEASTDAATVSGNAAGGSPTGTVTFYECGPTSAAAACTSTANPVGGPINLSPGAADKSTATSASFTPSALGYWCFAGYYSGNVNYRASSDTATNECVDVSGALTIVTTTVPHGLVGAPYSQTLTARGGTAPYKWGHTGTLPHGMSFSTSGVLSGTPTMSGTFSLVIKVSDMSSPRQYAAEDLKLVINSANINSSTVSTPKSSTIVLGSSNTDGAKVTGTTAGGTPTGTVTLLRVRTDSDAHPVHGYHRHGRQCREPRRRGPRHSHCHVSAVHAHLHRLLVLRR